MLRFNAVLVVVLVVFFGIRAQGQDGDVLERWYGAGVHAYFAGDLAGAERALTEAINGGTKDPRAYYFRGLTYLRLGRTEQAKADMLVGASFEARDPDGRYPVSRSLERIQGGPRQMLEGFRQQARLNAYQQQRTRWHDRYEALRRREEDVLRRQIVVPLDQFAVPVKDTVATKPAVSSRPREKQPAKPADQSAAVKPIEQPVAARAAKALTAPAPAASAPPRPATPAKASPKEPLTDPFGETPAPNKDQAKPAVREIPKGERVKARRLGKILTRVLGKSLPGGEEPSAPGRQRRSAGAVPAKSAAPPSPPADTDVFGTSSPKQPAGARRQPAPPAPRGKPATKPNQSQKTGTAPGKAPAKAAADNPFAESEDPFSDDATNTKGNNNSGKKAKSTN